MNTCVSNPHKTLIEIAVDVFKTQNLALVRSLKDFLTVLPNPKSVEEVLTAAIYQLAETEPEACGWLLHHASCLEPELDLVKLAMNLAQTSLQNQGFLLGQDFGFEPNGRLYISEKALAELMGKISTGKHLLLEEILQV